MIMQLIKHTVSEADSHYTFLVYIFIHIFFHTLNVQAKKALVILIYMYYISVAHKMKTKPKKQNRNMSSPVVLMGT